MSGIRRALLLGILLATLATSPASAYVYWANGSGATTSIARANNDGTGVNLHFIDVGGSVSSVTVNPLAIYWFNTTTKAIGKASIDGTNPNQSFIAVGSTGYVSASADGIFFTNQPSGSAPRISFASNDGMITTPSVVSEPSPAYITSSLAVSPTTVYRQRIQSGSIATLGRSNYQGSDDTVVPITPIGSGVTYNLLAATASNVFGVRASPSDKTYPITVSDAKAESFGQLIPGLGRQKLGLAVTGCQLYWSSAAAAATTYTQAAAASIGKAATDGSGVTESLISGAGITPGAVAADLLPAVDSGCATAAPPVATPTPEDTPIPHVPLTAEQLAALTAQANQPDPVKDDDSAWWSTEIGDLDPWGKYDTTDAERAATGVFMQWVYCLRLFIQNDQTAGEVQGCTATQTRSLSRSAMATRLAKGKSVSLGSVSAGSMTPAATQPTYDEAAASLTAINALRAIVRKQSKPIDKARTAVKKAKGAKKKKARKRLKKLIAKRAPTIAKLTALGVHPIAVKRTKVIAKRLKAANQRLGKHKPLSLVQTITVTDPATGISVVKVRKLKLVAHKK